MILLPVTMEGKDEGAEKALRGGEREQKSVLCSRMRCEVEFGFGLLGLQRMVTYFQSIPVSIDRPYGTCYMEF